MVAAVSSRSRPARTSFDDSERGGAILCEKERWKLNEEEGQGDQGQDERQGGRPLGGLAQQRLAADGIVGLADHGGLAARDGLARLMTMAGVDPES